MGCLLSCAVHSPEKHGTIPVVTHSSTLNGP